MAGYLILHGIANDRPPQHWQFQLAADLVRAGHDVRYPALPTPHTPVLDDWLSALDAELRAMPDGPRIVVCHSLACLLWIHAAGSGLTGVVDRVLLVAPPASDKLPEAGSSFRVDAFDGRAVTASARSGVAVVCSDADPYNPAGGQVVYADRLGVAATVIPGAAHFTPDSGYGHWSAALQWCLTGALSSS